MVARDSIVALKRQGKLHKHSLRKDQNSNKGAIVKRANEWILKHTETCESCQMDEIFLMELLIVIGKEEN